MKTMKFGRTVLQVPVIGLGCMRITGLNSVREVRTLVDTAMEQGVNFFDHADIYGKGESERIFGEATDPAMREKMIIQTKCGICPGISYDFSIDQLAEKYGVSNNAIAVAWILRHPARIQTIVGTTNKERLTQICHAAEIMITREEWYDLYMAAGKQLP